GVSNVNMEEGPLRCDANISVRPAGAVELGTKTELKNMNSFRFLERGIRAEIARQVQVLQGGGEVVQETLHYDPASDRLTSLRSKEEVHDYRYFPEPDLIPVASDEDTLARHRRRARVARRARGGQAREHRRRQAGARQARGGGGRRSRRHHRTGRAGGPGRRGGAGGRRRGGAAGQRRCRRARAGGQREG